MQIQIETSASDHTHLLAMAQPGLSSREKRRVFSCVIIPRYWFKRLQQLILLLLLGAYLHTEAQVQTMRQDFEDHGFGAMLPLGGVNVQGDHLAERYVSLYDGSQVKLINYKVDFNYKKSTETELELISGLKSTLKDNPTLSIREDISEIQTSRKNNKYRSLKLTTGTVNIDHFFFFRGNDVVLLRFEYKSTNQDYLSDVVASAVNQFLWLERKTVLSIPEMHARITLPGELKGVFHKAKKMVLLSLPDSNQTKYYRFRGTIEYLGEAGTYDTAKIKTALRKEISAIPASRLVYKTGLMDFEPDYLVEKYKIEFVEKGLPMEQYIFLIYTGKKMYRYTFAGANEFYYKIGQAVNPFDRLAKSIRAIN